MFHLRVSFRGWQESAGTLPTGRIYVKSEDEPDKHFLKDGKLDIAEVGRTPALLVSESGGPGPQFARVAYITGVTQGPRETAIQYVIDNQVPPISNADLEGLAPHLGISKFALTHTHWRILAADLFKVLLMNQKKNGPAPKIFSLDAINTQEADLVAVMMPFDAKFKPVYGALQRAAAAVGLKCMRADDLWGHQLIIQDIVSLIARARIVICDCSGKNSNVYYEAGIADALGKDTILRTQTEGDIPFDIRHLRHIAYWPNGEGRKALGTAVEARMRTILGG